jgi:hypothetical protein
VNSTKPLSHEAIPGDVIEIPPNDTAVLHPSGDEVFLAPQSSAVYLKQTVQLRYGTTKVSTKTRLTLSVHQYTITPTPAPPLETKYEVRWSNAGGRVRVYEGEVRVDGCNKNLTVSKDNIAELGRDCRLGAYLRPPDSSVDFLGIAVPILCYFKCAPLESDDGSNIKFSGTAQNR